MRKLYFWFDFTSTYSGISALEIYQLAIKGDLFKRGISIIPKPFMLGGVFKKIGLTGGPFDNNPRKFDYMWLDLKRLSQPLLASTGSIFSKPQKFPLNSILANRVATAIASSTKDGNTNVEFLSFIKEIYIEAFVNNNDISNPNLISNTIKKCLPNLNADSIMEKASSDDIKQLLKQTTDEAYELGLFGAPSFSTSSKEFFWGSDRLNLAMAAEISSAKL